MAGDEGTKAPVAEPDAGAVATPEPVISQDGETPQSESGTGAATSEQGLELLKQIASSVDDPEVIEGILSMFKRDALERAALVKDIQGRARQRGQQEALNELAARSRDDERYAEVVEERDRLVKELSSPDVDITAATHNLPKLRALVEEAKDHELRQAAFKVIRGTQAFAEYGEEEIEALRRVDGSHFDRWFREHLTRYGDVRERQGYEKALAEVERKTKGQDKLAEALAAAQAAAASRPGAPPPAGRGGAPVGTLTLEAYRAMTPEESAKLSPAEIDRMVKEDFDRRMRSRS
jgi:hypothetical protein